MNKVSAFTKKQTQRNRRSYRTSEDVRKEAVQLYETGLSAKEIGKKLGVGTSSVIQWAKDAGLHVRNSSEARGITDVIKKEAVRLYEIGLSTVAIEKRLGINNSTVGRIVRGAGITPRTEAEAKGVTKEMVVKGISMYQEGLSSPEIAKQLRVTPRTVHNWLKKNNIKSRTIQESHGVTKAIEAMSLS
jgi:transposase-like protein